MSRYLRAFIQNLDGTFYRGAIRSQTLPDFDDRSFGEIYLSRLRKVMNDIIYEKPNIELFAIPEDSPYERRFLEEYYNALEAYRETIVMNLCVPKELLGKEGNR